MFEKREILLVSYYFAPQNKIGAVRMTKLAKYLSRLGHEVTVLCGAGRDGLRDPTLARDLEELREVHVIREWNPIQDRKERVEVAQRGKERVPTPKSGRRTDSFVHRFLRVLYLASNQLSDASFYRRGVREIMSMNRRFDVVLSSYGPLSSHRIAGRLKEKGIAGQWIADFRDPVAMSFRWQAGMARRYVRKVGDQADGLNAVSRGVLQTLGFQDHGRSIPNGFDREDMEHLRPLSLPGSPLLRFAYCGQIYEGRRDLTPFFTILGRMLQEGVLQPEEVQVLYAGAEGTIMAAQARTAGAEHVVCDVGGIDRAQALALQQHADVLLMASWNTRSETGLLTGKLLEYMMIGKPVICCMSGDMPGSETKRIMEGTGLGFCWEQACEERDSPALEEYLHTIIRHARQGKPNGPKRRADAVERYAYPQIAGEFSRWMQEMGK